jgi:hypothetical protein
MNHLGCPSIFWIASNKQLILSFNHPLYILVIRYQPRARADLELEPWRGKGSGRHRFADQLGRDTVWIRLRIWAGSRWALWLADVR